MKTKQNVLFSLRHIDNIAPKYDSFDITLFDLVLPNNIHKQRGLGRVVWPSLRQPIYPGPGGHNCRADWTQGWKWCITFLDLTLPNNIRKKGGLAGLCDQVSDNQYTLGLGPVIVEQIEHKDESDDCFCYKSNGRVQLVKRDIWLFIFFHWNCLLGNTSSGFSNICIR